MTVGKPRDIATRNKIRLTLLGHTVSIETREKISKANKGKKLSKETRERMCLRTGINSCNWKGGISFNREYINKRQREWHHKTGRHKKYICKYGGTKIPQSYYDKKRYFEEKNGGNLPVEIIRKVYNENIKKYGELTCYLCLLPIKVRQDSLEHKIPLCRGGTNAYENLEIAHLKCNSSKGRLTYDEFIRGETNARKWRKVANEFM